MADFGAFREGLTTGLEPVTCSLRARGPVKQNQSHLLILKQRCLGRSENVIVIAVRHWVRAVYILNCRLWGVYGEFNEQKCANLAIMSGKNLIELTTHNCKVKSSILSHTIFKKKPHKRRFRLIDEAFLLRQSLYSCPIFHLPRTTLPAASGGCWSGSRRSAGRGTDRWPGARRRRYSGRGRPAGIRRRGEPRCGR